MGLARNKVYPEDSLSSQRRDKIGPFVGLIPSVLDSQISMEAPRLPMQMQAVACFYLWNLFLRKERGGVGLHVPEHQKLIQLIDGSLLFY